MQQHAAQPAIAVDIKASTAGALVIRSRVTTDPDGGPDLLALELTVWPGETADVTGVIAEVDALVETDDDALSCSFLGLDRTGLDRLIAHLTERRNQWRAAA